MKHVIKNALLALGFSVTLTPRVALAAGEGWVSSSHLGFATVRNSTTGFNTVSGSLVFLDAAKPLNAKVDLGLRTVAQGGEGPHASYYRLGAGPLINFHLTPNWQIHAAITSFNEAGLNPAGERIYQSKGKTAVVGWEKFLAVTARLGVAWGGFAILHDGDLQPTAALGLGSLAAPATAKQNRGISQGVEVALRFSL